MFFLCQEAGVSRSLDSDTLSMNHMDTNFGGSQSEGDSSQVSVQPITAKSLD